MKKQTREKEDFVQEVDTRIVDTDVDTVLTEVGEQAKVVSISRQDDKEKAKWNFLTKIPAPDFNLQDIRDTYGGGCYRGRILDEGAKFIKGFSFSIDPRFRGKPMIETVQSQSNLPVVQNQDQSTITRLEALMEKFLMIQMQPKKELDILGIVEKVASIMKPATDQNSFTQMKELFAVFKEGLTTGQEMNGDLGYLPVIERFGPPVLNLLEKAADKLGGNGQPILEKAKSNLNPPSNSPMSMFDQLLKFVPQIIPAAKNGIDHDQVIDGILDRIPPMFYDNIYREVNMPDFLSRVITAIPNVKEHEAWFVSFVEKFKEAVGPESEESINVESEESNELENQ